MTEEPSTVLIQEGDQTWQPLTKNAGQWQNAAGDQVALVGTDKLTVRLLAAPNQAMRLKLTWPRTPDPKARFTGDAFERTYGDMALTSLNEEKVYYWYALVQHAKSCEAYGVEVQPNAFCAWTFRYDSVSLWLDLRAGTDPLNLAAPLDCCTVVSADYADADAYAALKAFCQTLAQKLPALSNQSYVGINDWYYAYGHNNEKAILANTKTLVDLCAGLDYQPWTVIDDGWQVDHSDGYNGGPWTYSNDKFEPMDEVAAKIKHAGAHPGIWCRPLYSHGPADEALKLREEGSGYTLDPSNPETLAKVAADIHRFADWGFEVIKFDFSCYDVLGQWGMDLGLNYYRQPVHFESAAKTTAQVFKTLYQTIKAAAGPAAIMGCNTVSHLSAGIVDLMRIGDDTSGHAFHRTVNRGVNTLAFRLPQHNVFYRIDADCVGITDQISWAQNQMWLNLLAQSGTPLFISCSFDELSQQQLADLKKAFQTSLKAQGDFRPSTLEAGRYPVMWQDSQRQTEFNWDFDLFEQV